MAPPAVALYFSPVSDASGEYGSFTAAVEDELVDVPTLRAVTSDENMNNSNNKMEWDFSWLARRFPVIIAASVCTMLVITLAARHSVSEISVWDSGDSVKSDNSIISVDSGIDVSIPVVISDVVADIIQDNNLVVTDIIQDNNLVVTDIIQDNNLVVADMTLDSDLCYTLTRKGYSELQYFKSDNSVVTSYRFLEDYQAVIEPYVDMKLKVYEQFEGVTSYQYKLCDVTTGDTCYSGTYDTSAPDDQQMVNVPCKPFDIFTIEVTGYNSNNEEIVVSTSGEAVCMYIRREMRSMSDEDLQATMDAMHTMWTTTDDLGQQTYGSNFHSSTYFSIAHDFNAGQRDADHIHQGLGFAPQHIKLVNMFEASMQSVNPSVSLFYWDFTIDVSQGLTIYESPMFNENTFGTINPPKDLTKGFLYTTDLLQETAIPDGRWAFLKSEQYQLLTSARYGQEQVTPMKTSENMEPPANAQMKAIAASTKTSSSDSSSDMQGNAFGYMRGP